MDRGTIVGFRAQQLEAIRADQVLFTSIRSPMGEGYRIVAASPGLKAEERGEITRWSPSHGSLCSDDPSAEGIASYKLQSGRHCIAHSRYAGTEHTGRGGQRVLTHVVLVSAQDFERVGCNPLRVWAAVPEMVDALSDDQIPTQLPLLELEPDPHQVLAGGGLVGMNVDLLCGIVSEMLAGQRIVVCGARRSFAALEWVLMLLPATARAKVSVSAGIRLSPSRPAQLAWVDPDDGETERSLIGQSIQYLDLQKPLEAPDTAPREWFALLRRWWVERRWDEICLLTNSITCRVTAPDLVRISIISQAIDDAAVADVNRLAQYQTTCQRLKAGTDVERELIDRLAQVIEARRQAIDRELQKAEASGSVGPPRMAKFCG